MDRFFYDIVQTIREPLIVLGQDLRVLQANESFYRLFRLSPANVEGQNFFSVEEQWDSPALRVLISEVMTLNRAFDDFDLTLLSADAGPRHFLLNARQIVGNGGSPLVLLAIEDVSLRRSFESERQQLLSRLQAANRELQEFAQVASHDLQEPLRKIQAFGDRLRIDAWEVISPESRSYLDRMLSASVRMQSLINDLLTFARLDSREPKFSPVDLQDIVFEAIEDLEGSIDRSSDSIEIPSRLHVIHADASQMRQLFQNLIGNALKYRKPGAPARISITSKTVSGLKSCPKGPCVQMCIADNGIGFDEKYLDRIFNMFQRLHGRHEYEGTGVGLAVCRKIADRHGGFITATSTPGVGATFIVTLPINHPSTHQRA